MCDNKKCCETTQQNELEIFATEAAKSIKIELTKRDSILMITIVLLFTSLMFIVYLLGVHSGKISALERELYSKKNKDSQPSFFVYKVENCNDNCCYVIMNK